jgi:HNH endonuclease
MRLPQIRARNGKRIRGWHISEKGYPRYHSGPYENKYVHRVKMELLLGRELTKDEDVHHKNGNKLDFSKRNLKLLGHKEHGWVSAKQHWFMSHLDRKREREWNEYFDEKTDKSLRSASRGNQPTEGVETLSQLPRGQASGAGRRISS